MYKLFKIILCIASFMFIACGEETLETEYISSPYDVFVLKKDSIDKNDYYGKKDTFELIDSKNFTDTFIGKFSIHNNDFFNYDFKGTKNEIEASFAIKSDWYGGNIEIVCSKKFNLYESRHVKFTILAKKNLTNKSNYAIELKDSLEVRNKWYKNVLIFDASNAKENSCSFEKAFIARDNGLIKLDINDTISLQK